MLYYEIAIGSPANRGSLFPQDELPEIVKQHGNSQAIYRSVYAYPETAISAITDSGSVKEYYGERFIEVIPIDIDKGDSTDLDTMKVALEVVNMLENKYRIAEGNYKIYFSGTGYHIDITNSCFGFSSSNDLFYTVKDTMTKMFGKVVDPMIYMRTGLYRVAYSLNVKSGLYKVPISRADLESLCYEHIVNKAKSIDVSDVYYEDIMGDLRGNNELNKYIVRNSQNIREFQKITEPVNVATCVYTLYSQGPKRGNRNMSVLRMASHYRRCGIPSEAAKAILLHWNKKSLEDAKIIENIENVYNRNYRYGCDDTILKQHCSTRCIHYRNKDYNVKMYSAEEMQKRASVWANTDFTGRTINLAKMLGQPEIDCEIFPGELVTIMGPTGSGKTAFTQHLILGMDMFECEPHQEWQLDTNWLSLELSDRLMHRRNLQIVGGYDKKWLSEHLSDAYRKNKDLLQHILIRTTSGSIKDIEEIIRRNDPKVIVIDYIDLVEADKRNEHETVKAIMHGLSSLAVNYDIIIIAIAQIRREDARARDVDLFSGKGSGAIENASRKVIALNGMPHNPRKEVKVVKNTDGELLESVLEHDGKTLRFKVKNPSENQNNISGGNNDTP